MEEGSGNGHLFLWGSRWEGWKGFCCPGTYMLKKGLETEHLSIQELCEGNLEGVSFTGDTKGYVEEDS